MKTKSKITDKNFFVKLYNAKEKHWLRTILIFGFLGIISFTTSSIIRILNLSDDNGWIVFLSWTSLILFWLLFFATIFIQISDVIYNKFIKGIDKNNEKSLNFNLKLIGNINSICNEKLNTLIDVIDKVNKRSMASPLIIDNPCNQLRNISVAISDTINYALNGNNVNNDVENDVRVNIFYSLCNEKNNDWKLSYSEKFEYNDIKDITDNKQSLFNFALNETSNIIMRNNKQNALNEGHYIRCQADIIEDDKLMGSILYYKIPIKDKQGKTIINIVIMVYTCQRRFAEENLQAVKIAKYNIETVLLRFKPRIQIELCLHYLDYLHG